MDTNSGEPWSEMDVWELKHSMEYGRASRKWRASCIVMRVRFGRWPPRSASKRAGVWGKFCERRPA